MRTFLAAALLCGVAGTASADEDIRHYFFDENEIAWSKMDGFEQANNLFRVRMGFADASYITDALGDKLTPLGRAAYVFECLTGTIDPVSSAMCQGDVEAFDAAKALAEIDADTKHAAYHQSAKKLVADAKALADAQPAKVKAFIAQDDAFKKMFELAATARKQQYGSAELRAVLAEVEDGWRTGSRKALAGCEAKVWPFWVKAVSAIPADRFTLAFKESEAEIRAAHADVITGTVDGYLAAVAVVDCFPVDSALAAVNKPLLFAPGYRGPRTGAYAAMRKANLELDKKDAMIPWPSIDRRAWWQKDATVTTGQGGAVVIKSATKKGDKIHVVFDEIKAKTTKCVDYHEGTTPSRIDEHGRIVYESSCGKYAEVMQSYSAPDPSDDDLRYAPGLKAGAYAGFAQDTINWVAASPKAKHPIVVLGAPVK